MTTADELVAALARETARSVEALAVERALAWVNERDHLQPACVDAARRVAGGSRKLVVSTSLWLKSERWPRLGRIDLSFVPDVGAPIVVELKSGAGKDALAACAWDAVKLAFLLRLGHVAAAYLLAATPAADWQLARRGTEFFESRTIETAALREPYLDWWRAWERDGYAAGSNVPASFTTRRVCTETFSVNATEWQVRVAAIEADGDAWIQWDPTLPGGQERLGA